MDVRNDDVIKSINVKNTCQTNCTRNLVNLPTISLVIFEENSCSMARRLRHEKKKKIKNKKKGHRHLAVKFWTTPIFFILCYTPFCLPNTLLNSVHFVLVKSIATKMFSWRDRLDSLLLRNLTILFRVKSEHFVYCHESLLVLCFRDDFSSEMAIVKTFRCNKQTNDYCHEKYKNGR
jgi:hypothetical protein